MEILYQIGLIILCGVLGRMGGSGNYPRWTRIWLCPLTVILSLWLLAGFHYIYIPIYLLTALSLSTYWDWLFGFDNLWFSGFMCGLAFLPLMFMGVPLWIVLSRSIILALLWGSLNKYLPSAGIDGKKRIIIWRRDIVEEFLRYASMAFLF